MNIRTVYQYALQRERQGYDFFDTNAGRMSHAAAAAIFRQLAAEEQRHIQFIEGLIEALDGSGDAASTAAMADVDLFAERSTAEDLSQTIIESMVPDVAILRTAYLIERDFAEFYESSAGSAEGVSHDALLALARWERGHERLFKDLHDRVFREYAEMPWGG